MNQRNLLSVIVITALLLSSCGDKSNAPQNEVSHKTKELITFKGIPIGKPESEDALQKLCLALNSKEECLLKLKKFKENKDGTYYIYVPYGNIDLFCIFSLESNGAVAEISATSSKQDILTLAEILEAKYGKSEKIRSTVENGMGTKFEKETFVWVDDQGNRIIVDSMYGKIDEGRIIIQSASQIAAGILIEKMQKEAAKSNL